MRKTIPISYKHTCWISLWSEASSKASWKDVKALLIWHWREVCGVSCKALSQFGNKSRRTWRLGSFCPYLQALNSAFEEREEGGVWIDGLSLFKDRFGFCKACECVWAIQSEERLHHCVVPQQGQAARQAEMFHFSYVGLTGNKTQQKHTFKFLVFFSPHLFPSKTSKKSNNWFNNEKR